MRLIANTAAIATGYPLGAAAGLEVLQDGGNAVDAAVAAMLAMCVVVPGSVGLGGYGGSAVVHHARSERTIAVDFDSCAPLSFREGMVTADRESSYYGPRSVTVPAVVAGFDLILREFGTKSWSDVSQPAIRLAENGFEFDAEHKRQADRCAPKFDRQSIASIFPAGQVPQIADCWKQPDLARLLNRLAFEGPTAFYQGEIAERIVRFLNDRGGILSEEDFRSYRPRMTEPVYIEMCSRSFQSQLKLYTPPPPSGGITSFGIVQTLEKLGAVEIEPWSGQYFHVLAEATKICWQDRRNSLGDPDFVNIPMEQLLSDRAAEARAQKVRAGNILSGAATAEQSPHTANVIANDAEGNLISLTATQGWMYGSHLVVDGMGLVLNHGMSRFDYMPDHPNSPAPGKRMQHNMAPAIALCDSPSPLRGGARGGVRPAYAFGLPGGPKIVNVTAQLVFDTMASGTSPADAIAVPRLHTEGEEPLLVSQHMPANVVAELERRGHTVRCEDDMGGPVNVLAIDPETGKIDIASGEGTGAVAGF